MAFTQSEAIEVKRVRGKGRGVFARRPIRKGELIERVPMIVLAAREYEEGVAGTVLANYMFNWGAGTVGLALGYGSVYNHSYRPNARYDDVGVQTKRFTAIRDIAAGEEITINYNGRPASRARVWFDVAEDAAPGSKNDSTRGAR